MGRTLIKDKASKIRMGQDYTLNVENLSTSILLFCWKAMNYRKPIKWCWQNK
ncbi:MAG: hypothetical protein HC906_15945 [Bacteroidales bacterium]|nr:hypothetical protein [Bacteroidales bacterium]